MKLSAATLPAPSPIAAAAPALSHEQQMKADALAAQQAAQQPPPDGSPNPLLTAAAAGPQQPAAHQSMFPPVGVHEALAVPTPHVMYGQPMMPFGAHLQQPVAPTPMAQPTPATAQQPAPAAPSSVAVDPSQPTHVASSLHDAAPSPVAVPATAQQAAASQEVPASSASAAALPTAIPSAVPAPAQPAPVAADASVKAVDPPAAAASTEQANLAAPQQPVPAADGSQFDSSDLLPLNQHPPQQQQDIHPPQPMVIESPMAAQQPSSTGPLDALSPMRQDMQQQQQQQQVDVTQPPQQAQQQQDPQSTSDMSSQPRPSIPARPSIPSMPLSLVSPSSHAEADDTTPRNPDGSVNFDARHRHTPRKSGQQEQTPVQAGALSPAGHVGLHADNADIKTLHPDEVAELHQMFQQFDLNGDDHLQLRELSRFLSELEFTYSEEFIQYLIDHVFGMHIHQRVSATTSTNSSNTSIQGQLTFAEFLEFMRVFYWLHDHVCQEIERQFLHAFGKPVDDECIAILCRMVRFNQHAELDFNEMNLRLVEAVNEEAQRAREEQRMQATGGQYGDNQQQQQQQNLLSSPLAQQHYEAQLREQEQRDQERLQRDEGYQREMAEMRARQQAEEQEKRRLWEQREQFRAQAMAQQGQQMQGQYPDASEDQRRRSAAEQDDPFAYHAQTGPNDPQQQQPLQKQQPLQSPVQMRMDLATRLAASLDQSDHEYIRRSWDLLLKHFDRANKGGIAVTDIAQAFRAMGLDPSAKELNEFYVKADLDHSGVINFDEWKAYYTDLYNSYLRRGLELGQVKRVFRSFDEDGDGRVSIAEFRHVVKQICPSDVELSESDVERLVKLVDANGDGEVDFREFLDLVRLSASGHEARPSTSTVVARMGDNPDVARHEQMLAYRAARALTRKIIRAHMPSPMEHILAYAHMPSTFRPSMLARYQSRDEFLPSSIINPVLHCSGMYYEQFQMDPRSKTLRPTPLVSSTGVADPSHTSYFIELDAASGIPLPEVEHRSDIVARRCRVCVLEGTKPISNLYMAKAEWDASEEDRWRFTLKFQENDWNSFVWKTTKKNCTLLFELTCLVKKQGTNEKMKGESVFSLPHSASSYVEMSCGFATLDLDLSQPILRETRLERGVMGGNMEQREMLKDEEILARRSGWKAVTQLFAGPVKSQLTFRISPARVKDERLVNYLRYLPCDLILAWSSVEVVKLFLEILASFILLPQFQPLQIGKSCQLSIQLFLKHIVDVPDALQVLAETWSERRKTIKKIALREHDAGAIAHIGASDDAASDITSAYMLDRFRECIMKLYPFLSMGPGVLPQLIIGITDLKRLSLLRMLVHSDDTLRILTNDGMMRSGAVGSGGGSGVTRAPMSLARAGSVQNYRENASAAASAAAAPAAGARKIGGTDATSQAFRAASSSSEVDPFAGTVEFKNVFAPFHTNEIAFCPNSHSEDHHSERRAQIQFAIELDRDNSYASAPPAAPSADQRVEQF